MSAHVIELELTGLRNQGSPGHRAERKRKKQFAASMDQFDRERVLELRKEIASLQRDNESYRLQEHHRASEAIGTS